MGSLYHTDFAAWSAEQAQAIREAGRRQVNAPVDWENVAEEIESLGRSERHHVMADYGETPRQALEAIAHDEVRVLGDWLPDRRSSAP